MHFVPISFQAKMLIFHNVTKFYIQNLSTNILVGRQSSFSPVLKRLLDLPLYIYAVQPHLLYPALKSYLEQNLTLPLISW